MNLYRMISPHRYRPPIPREEDDPSISYPPPGRLTLNEDTIFPRKVLSRTVSQSASDLNEVILSVFGNELYIPPGICSEIVLYSLTLIPGVYNLEGTATMGMHREYGCSCRLILNDDSCVVGGTFQENWGSANSFEYEVTNGTYDYISGG